MISIRSDGGKFATELSQDNMWKSSGCVFKIRYVYHFFYNAHKIISFILRIKIAPTDREDSQEMQLHFRFHVTCPSSIFFTS
jgi:hypothetical protein